MILGTIAVYSGQLLAKDNLLAPSAEAGTSIAAESPGCGAPSGYSEQLSTRQALWPLERIHQGVCRLDRRSSAGVPTTRCRFA